MPTRCTVTAVLVVLAGNLWAAGDEYPCPKLLMEPAELVKPDVARQFIVLDARSRAAYDTAHLPNARWVDHDAWKTSFGDGDDADGWSQRIGDLAIGPGARVVVYDDAAAKNSARIWWILRYWGIDDVRLLNGGWKTWQAENLPTSTAPPEPATTAAFVAKPRPRQLVAKQQMLNFIAGSQRQIVDARSHDEFCGIEREDNQRGGAIPGAKHLEWRELTDQKTDRFKSPEQLRRLFARAQIDLRRPTASYCQSGGRASVMVFGLQLMGVKDARNYVRGWSEWGNSEDTPITVPAASDDQQAAPKQ